VCASVFEMPATKRPSVTIVVPFHGTVAEAEATLDALGALILSSGDRIIVADNTGATTVHARDGVTVVAADAEQSSYHARNRATEQVTTEWIAYIDADCTPSPDLLEAFFAEAIGDEVGAVVGEVRGREDQDALVARYSRSRGHIAQEGHFHHPYRPFGVTANLLVRREAWASVGGFCEGLRSGGDVDFSWRLQEVGWRLDYRPAAVVEHAHRERVRALAKVSARYGAGRTWLHRRYPDGMERPPLARPLLRAVLGSAVWLVLARRERSAFKALDGVFVTSQAAAGLLSNTPPGQPEPATPAAVAVVCAAFPALDDPEAIATVRRLAEPRHCIVEAQRRPVRQDRRAARELGVRFSEDDGTLRRLAAVVWLAARSPIRVLDAARASGLGAVLEAATGARRIAGSGAVRIDVVGGPAADARAATVRRLLGRSAASPPPAP